MTFIQAADAYKHLLMPHIINNDSTSYSFCSDELQELLESKHGEDSHCCDHCPFNDPSHQYCAASSHNPNYQLIIDYLAANHPEFII